MEASSITLVEVGTNGKGNLYAKVRSLAGGIGTVKVLKRDVSGEVRATGGNIGLVKANGLTGAITARRDAANNGGSIAEIHLNGGTGRITADNFLGKVITLQNSLRITAQSGALFNDAGTLVLFPGTSVPVLQALDFFCAGKFGGSITFSYGDNATPFAFRVNYNYDMNGVPLLDASITGKQTVWLVKRTAGTDAAVNLRNAVFSLGKFVLEAWATKVGTNNQTTDWTVALPKP